jgi:hypothetical protein
MDIITKILAAMGAGLASLVLLSILYFELVEEKIIHAIKRFFNINNSRKTRDEDEKEDI